MSAGFTKGPWEWWDDGESLVRITEAAEQKLIAQTALPSNARLIAAAPDAFTIIEQLEESFTADGTYQQFLPAMRAFLAKVRGEAL